MLRTWLISLGVFSLVGLSSPSRTSWSVKVTRKRAEYRANQEQQRLQEGMSFAQRQQWYQQQQNMMRRNRQWVAAQRCVHPDLPLEKIRPPQFLMISCAKCGSTAFYFQGLCKHPKIKCRARHKVCRPSQLMVSHHSRILKRARGQLPLFCPQEGNWFRTNYALHYHSAEEFYKAYTKESFQRLAPRVCRRGKPLFG